MVDNYFSPKMSLIRLMVSKKSTSKTSMRYLWPSNVQAHVGVIHTSLVSKLVCTCNLITVDRRRKRSSNWDYLGTLSTTYSTHLWHYGSQYHLGVMHLFQNWYHGTVVYYFQWYAYCFGQTARQVPLTSHYLLWHTIWRSCKSVAFCYTFNFMSSVQKVIWKRLDKTSANSDISVLIPAFVFDSVLPSGRSLSAPLQ